MRTNMDLSNYKTTDAEWVLITDPLGNPTDIKILIASRDSDVFRKQTRKISELERKRGTKGLKAVETERMWIETLAKCTLEWENLEDDGKNIPLTLENAIEIYTKYPFVMEQILNFIQDRENFLSN